METKEELELLQAEILNLFNYIQRVRKEVAAITRSDEGNGRFDNMSDQLDAIVQATEVRHAATGGRVRWEDRFNDGPLTARPSMTMAASASQRPLRAHLSGICSPDKFHLELPRRSSARGPTLYDG